MPYTDRLDYICSLTNNWAYALAVEKLTGRRFPSAPSTCASSSRADAHSEPRLVDRLPDQEMGASGTPLMYAFREREKILDLFESLTGSRMMCNYMRFGGCRVDASRPGSMRRAKWSPAAGLHRRV
jgi:NADH-quinone oxidoreductase subunit D